MTVELCELTPRGRGAISVVGVRGDEACQMLDDCFTPAASRKLSQLAGRSIIYGKWKSSGEDLIVVRIDDADYEVQCHGGIAAVATVVDDLTSQGAIPVPDRAGWRLTDNALQASVLLALQRCQTKRTATHLLRQYELWANADDIVKENANAALAFSSFGQHLTEPWSVMLCGEPNVGKSSLINALAGYERAIVNPTAGTTRDVIRQQTAIDGWPVELIDSAGIRAAQNQIEQEGIRKANQIIETADLVIHVLDATQPTRFNPAVSQHRAGLIVLNKIDLLDGPAANLTVSCPVIEVSATQGSGIDTLQQQISRALVPAIPDENQWVPISAEHRTHLQSIV